MKIRTFSSLPISVGTGLAIEALVQTPLASYSSFLINIKTLIRNAIEAFDKDYNPTPTEIFEAVSEDMRGIAETIVGLKLTNHLELKYYYPSYAGLKGMFPLASLKAPKTDIQIKEYNLSEMAGKKIIDKFEKIIIKNNVFLPDFKGDSLIITNHPVDLATSKSYTRLHLLESHTGVLKSFPEFYTKLTGGSKLGNIPLNKITIQIFGDDATDFYAIKSVKVKNAIKILADEANWSSASTPAFVYSTIRSLKKSPDKEILLKMI